MSALTLQENRRSKYRKLKIVMTVRSRPLVYGGFIITFSFLYTTLHTIKNQKLKLKALIQWNPFLPNSGNITYLKQNLY